MITEHAEKWSPSGAAIWANCNAQPEMVKGKKSGSSAAALEGEAAHWFCEQSIKGNVPSEGSTAPNGHIITEDIIFHCQEYIKLIKNTPGDLSGIETRLNMPSIHPDCFGTVDHWSYCKSNPAIYITDFKYGYGTVDSWWQHICYLVGVFDTILRGEISNKCVVVLRTVQPRAFHLHGTTREYRTTFGEITTLIDTLIKAANSEPLLSSGSWCRYCEAQLTCPANQHAARNAVDVSNMSIDVNQTNIGREISILQEAKERISNRLTALEAEAEHTLQQGGHIEGWVLERGRSGGRSSWTISKKEVLEWGQMFNVKVSKNDVITPVQAIAAGMPEQFVKANCKMPKAPLKLTSAGDTLAVKLLK